MKNSTNNNLSIDTILESMSKDISYLVKSVDSIERKLESKVDLLAFTDLKEAFIRHKDDTTTKLSSHAWKLGIGTGIAIAVSYIIK